MTSDVTIGSALTQQSRTAASSQSLADDFSQFLILLTTQLQNQDPLSPMDSSEFTSQLVAFSAVEQQINTNQKLDSLVSLQLSNSMSNALDYVGMEASYVSTEMYFDGEHPVNVNYALQGDAIETKVRIVNEVGDIIYEEKGSTSAGNNKFVWDGKKKDGTVAEPGTYEVRIDSLDPDGKAVDSTVVVSGLVRGVETQNGLIFLLVGERAVSLSTVLNVKLPTEIDEGEADPPAAADPSETGETETGEGDPSEGDPSGEGTETETT